MGSSGPEQLRIDVREDGADGEIAVGVTGEVDLGSVEQLREAVLGLDLAGRRLVIGLAAVTFMDSSGLAVLLEAAARAAAVVLDRPSPIVRRVLEATGVGERFTVRS